MKQASEYSKKVASNIADLLNSYSLRPKEVCQEMSKQHRTLQQTFTRLCVEWLKTCADDGYCVDERNEASQKIGRAFVEKVDSGEFPLPFI